MKKPKRKTFRLSPELEAILLERAKALGVDYSEYLRQLIAKDSGVCPLCGQPVKTAT